eukprot:m.74708 g.74708  ORF g.74708 m.74708 type:complete len:353 (-) comp12475_c0_seq2:1178-2236(-)
MHMQRHSQVLFRSLSRLPLATKSNYLSSTKANNFVLSCSYLKVNYPYQKRHLWFVSYKPHAHGDYEPIATTDHVPEAPSVPEHIQRPVYAQTPPVSETKSNKIPILTEEEQQRLRAACQLAKEALDHTVQHIQPGITTHALDVIAHEFIVAHDAYPSPLTYPSSILTFPRSICTSVNNVACHGIPDDRELLPNDSINVDITVYLNGMHGDTSRTVIVSETDDRGQRLLECSQACLAAGIAVCEPGSKFSDIGKVVEKTAEDYGFAVCMPLCGHGIGKNFHENPLVYHCYDPFSKTEIMQPGMAFTIEPAICEIDGSIEVLPDQWTVVTKDGGRCAQFEHTLLIVEDGVEVLT